jgi:hypothetical protein
MSEDFSFGIGVNVDDKALKGAIDTLEKLKAQGKKGVDSPFSGISKKELNSLKKTTNELLNPKTDLPKKLKKTSSGIDDMTKRMSKFGSVAASSFTMRGGMSVGMLRSLGSQFGGLGLTAGIVAHNVMKTAENVDSLTKKTQALGLSTKDVYDLSHALTLSGAEDGEASAASLLSKIKEIQDESKRGGGAFTGVIQEASIRGGSDISQVFMNEDPLESFRDLVKYFDDVPEVNKDDILKGFGFDTGAANVIRGGLAEFDKSMKESRDIGSTKEQFEAISKASADLEDALARLGRKFDSITVEPMTKAIEAITKGTKIAEETTSEDIQFNAAKILGESGFDPFSILSNIAFNSMGESQDNDLGIPGQLYLKAKDLVFGEEKKPEQKIQKTEKTYNIKVEAKTNDSQEIARKIAAQIRAIEAIEEENPL